MSLDPAALAAEVARQGAVARVVVAHVRGSVPREVGAAMLVWDGGQSGTVGGGALEWQAAAAARALLAEGRARQVMELPLGPALGQCCGGHVTLLIERWDGRAVAALDGTAAHARPLNGADGAPPLAVRAALKALRSGAGVAAGLIEGWLVEPVAAAPAPVWIWGAGHVGRAIVTALTDLPVTVTWIDDARPRFPDTIPAHATMLVAANPADAVAHAPATARHLVLTYSHALDLELCHRILSRPFAGLGLIGSATKKARFLSRLRALGHSDGTLMRLQCPIGEPCLGKSPGAIAVGVAHALLRELNGLAAADSGRAAGEACG